MYKHEIGVCIDENVAYLLEERSDEHLITVIKADDDMDNTRHQKDHVFYKKVFDMIQDFDTVLLLGTTRAKNEMSRRMRAKKLKNIVFHENVSETVSENQKIEFINGFFKAAF